ncbi:MAG: hypothetical protein AB8H79_03860 [Myxococcota bacterium]
MLITHLRTEGLKTADGVDLVRPGRRRQLTAGPAGIGLLDGLELAMAACDPARTAKALVSVGLIERVSQADVFVENAMPIQVTLDGGDVTGLVDPGQSRTIVVHVDAELDPPLFGRLREHALRDPRLVSALGEATLSLKAGFVWTNDLTTASISILSAAVGGVSFPLVGADRPTWLTGLLAEVSARIQRVPDATEAELAERLVAASMSTDPDVRLRFERVCDQLDRAPFSLGRLNLVQAGGRVRTCFGPSLLRPQQLGPGALQALRLAIAVIMDQPDVLTACSPTAAMGDPQGVRDWVMEATSGDDAVLEQFIEAPGGGTPALEVA